MYGANDSKDRGAVERAMRNLSAVIDACAQAGTVPIVATIPPRGYSKRGQGEQVRFNQALVSLARSKKVPVSYAFEEMIQRDLQQMLYDGVHLTPGPGNDAAGEALWKTFQQVTFALRDSSETWH
jgi:lysophospholipase L1-like esterase